MRYHGMVIRPPSEANSYILQVTYGCSHNHCTFCGTYLDKPFQARKTSEVLEDIQTAQTTIPGVRRVFLADGDALVLSTRRLEQILDALRVGFPKLERVGMYAAAQNLLAKSVDELAQLHQKGLGIVYLGLESGSDEVLARVEKGVGSAEMIAAIRKAKQAGLLVSVIGILGIGGMEFSEEHAQQTGRVVNVMNPDYFSMLTLMLVPGTPLYNQWQAGSFLLPNPSAMLMELHRVISQLDDLTQCVFRTNHASNYLPLRGTLSQDKEHLLSVLDAALAQGETALRPEAWRGL
ncbi:MAG: B12-binding domain-containing radical SAM protein [Chloroflexi bacterium]|nr:B12-binding domain-containing radical SAM protein [Chloroflexota bacterium]MBL6966491.1 B12-binding domain-containing radical SAM protein [Anaerolineales bacterium]